MKGPLAAPQEPESGRGCWKGRLTLSLFPWYRDWYRRNLTITFLMARVALQQAWLWLLEPLRRRS